MISNDSMVICDPWWSIITPWYSRWLHDALRWLLDALKCSQMLSEDLWWCTWSMRSSWWSKWSMMAKDYPWWVLMVQDNLLMITWWLHCLNHVSHNSDKFGDWFGENTLLSLFFSFHSHWIQFVFRMNRSCQVRTDEKVWNYPILVCSTKCA